ncbi:hypothetical protein MLD38_008560 [Melastoma candidum]|uniref:Uncharacterized protein n=1 Tax=Melastoma candidum TaxID=119954 RepID=A0ACB9RUC7_9MYRT|nr:hypothetical protein MLD38_008560 [Melastoma candidum]
MTADEASRSISWTREEDKAFENALANYPEDLAFRWEKIASVLPRKTIKEIKHHYELLIDDIKLIESGRVNLPPYISSTVSSMVNDGAESCGKKGYNLGNFSSESNHVGKGSRSDQDRRKGIAWTEDEHRLFLLGLEKYGKGDWRSISRNFVVTRTPTQVASHAQKYFIRLNSINKERRRSSIHDITSVRNAKEGASQVPITGQVNGATGVSSV